VQLLSYSEKKGEPMNKPFRPSGRYEEARRMLPADLYPVFDELIEHYKFAADKHHGHAFVSPKVIAELVLMGWRNTEAYRDPLA
jgi:hypothetical protein